MVGSHQNLNGSRNLSVSPCERGVVRSHEAPTMYLWNGWSSHAVNLGVRSAVCEVNWWRSSVTSLSHWLPTSVSNTVGVKQRVARLCQLQRRLVY